MKDLPWVEIRSYASSRYGYEGSEQNYSDIHPEEIIYPFPGGNGIEYGRWEKVSPIHGQYELKVANYPGISPPPVFGIDVSVDGSMLASDVLPNGEKFNHHSETNLEALLGISLVDQIVLPISVR